MNRVIFFHVRDAASKLKWICQTTREHFEKQEPFLILVEDIKSQEFVDDLLWRLPETSFLPHVVSDEPTNDFIAITKTKNNVNQARVAFNLCSTPLLIDSPFRIIYEFEDLTNPNKSKLSSIRFDAYKAAHFLIEAKS
ncbi:MAG TPA: DNA polymerase III subunit chi [Chlamydiales bacterium]|nr:DNA polymerase III subunit chi [Chlamydiales bacterium]